MKSRPLAERFWEKVDDGDEDECWEWQANTQSDGYGMIWHSERGRMVLAHRVSVRLDGRDVDDKVLHHCDNPPCVNPNHLYVGSQSDNMRDATDRGGLEHPSAEDHHNSKLTNEQAREIRESDMKQQELADKYDVSTATISHVQTGKRYEDA